MSCLHNKTIYEALGRDPVHPFPARMAPGIVLEIVEEAQKPLRVLDPMTGSGTVLALACSRGHQAFGVDIDPLAILISRVWTTAIDPDEVCESALNVLCLARQIFAKMRHRDAYPRDADLEVRRFVSYWFDPYARRQLVSLADAIETVEEPTIRDVLWCAFSRLIITKQSGASLAMDLSHSRPHKSFRRAPSKPFRKFLSAVERVVKNCLDRKDQNGGPTPIIYEGDARNLPLADASVDLVLTSPPYLNAIDYFRCSKFSLVWMGYSITKLRRLRAESVGTEVGGKVAVQDEEIIRIISKLRLVPKLAARDKAVLAQYISDMRRVTREVARVLSPGGKAIYVIGENTIRGTFVRNSVIISAVAELAGLKLERRRLRTLPANRRYLPPPSKESTSAAIDGRMRREVILSFSRPSAA